MDDLIERKMAIYKETSLYLSPSTDCINKIKKGKCRKTKVAQKLIIANTVVCLLIISMIPVTAYAAYQVSQVLYDKIKNSSYSQEDMVQLEQDLHKYGFSENDISNLTELNTNEFGLTYGPDILGADLIEVVSKEGNIGYIYRKDLDAEKAATLENALDDNRNIVLKVYDKNGKKEIGTFVLTNDGKTQ